MPNNYSLQRVLRLFNLFRFQGMASRYDKPESVLSASTLRQLDPCVRRNGNTCCQIHLWLHAHQLMATQVNLRGPGIKSQIILQSHGTFQTGIQSKRNLANTPTYNLRKIFFKKPPKSHQPPLTPGVAQIFPPTALQALRSWVHLSNCWA